MKNISLIISLLAIVLVSCAPESIAIPISTATNVPLPTATFTPHPTLTFTPEPTATDTPLPIPDFMDEYIKLGLDTISSDSLLCFVIDKAKVHYSPLEGIIYKERVIRSWIEVDYIRDEKLYHGIILEYVRRGGDVQSDYTKMIYSNSGALIPNPSIAFVQTMHNGWAERTPTEHTIACGVLGLNPPSETPLIDGIDFQLLTMTYWGAYGNNLLFDGFFPVVDGKAQSIKINGIGEVLPITQCSILSDLLVEQK